MAIHLLLIFAEWSVVFSALLYATYSGIGFLTDYKFLEIFIRKRVLFLPVRSP